MTIFTFLRSIYACLAKLSGKAGPTQQETPKNAIPSMLSRPWTLHFKTGSVIPPPPGLEDGDQLSIISQVANLYTDAISGVVTNKAGKQYPLNGQIDEKFDVTFFVTSGIDVYLFKGTAYFAAGAISMEGRFQQVSFTDIDEGNWSAQAQGGGEEDTGRSY